LGTEQRLKLTSGIDESDQSLLDMVEVSDDKLSAPHLSVKKGILRPPG
jgi:hypothetical protein